MKILFLGGNNSRVLANWLTAQGEEVTYTEKRISLNDARELNNQMIVSYNYKYILSRDILDLVEGNAINLHISYLPYNRGADPNIWSFIENTPKGVTIHYIDSGIDTGDIIVQKQIQFNEEKETLKLTYDILHREIQELFKRNWKKIKSYEIERMAQIGEGTIHLLKDRVFFEPLIKEKGWDTPIKGLREKYHAKIGC